MKQISFILGLTCLLSPALYAQPQSQSCIVCPSAQTVGNYISYSNGNYAAEIAYLLHKEGIPGPTAKLTDASHFESGDRFILQSSNYTTSHGLATKLVCNYSTLDHQPLVTLTYVFPEACSPSGLPTRRLEARK